MAEVTERWSVRTYTRGRSARRVFDVTQVTDEAQALAELYSQRGVREGVEFPLEANLKVPPGGMNVTRNGRVYVVSADYQAPAGFSFPDGAADDLLAQKWRISSDPFEEDEKAYRDWANVPYVNSSGQPFDDITRPVPGITIPMWRWESSFELSKHLAYRNRWNSDSVVLPKLGTAAPGELLCRCIKLKDEVESEAEVVAVLYVFEARPRITLSGTWTIRGTLGNPIHGFHRRLLDTGTEGYSSDGKNPITYKTGANAGQQVSIPVRLNGKGAPLDTTNFDISGAASSDQALVSASAVEVLSDGVWIYEDTTDGSIAYAGLNIGANL